MDQAAKRDKGSWIISIFMLPYKHKIKEAREKIIFSLASLYCLVIILNDDYANK